MDAYKAFGLTIRSEIMLPELFELSDFDNDKEADVQIILQDLTSIPEVAQLPNNGCRYQAPNFYFKFDDAAIFCVSARTITASPFPNCNEAALRLYILGTCMAVILLQRKILPLHGSAVVIDGQAYAIVGESGAGKSTLAAAFLQQGYKMLTDDVIAVTMDDVSGRPTVIPSYPQQKLWEESVSQLQMKDHDFNELYQDNERVKFAVPVAEQFETVPVPLGGIFELSISGEGLVVLKTVTGLDRFPLLLTHTYRNFLVSILQMKQWHFALSAQLAEKVPVYKLRRPMVGMTAHELVECITNEIREGVTL
ncbi:ATP-binding cassette domain-containing protein [Paenibacillus sp. PR3]|uniref:ATP-binding cassette domain-containing protein n=1 Tax=Paenibacillus terricola TaxID=2763503 RepID=A0ABR8MZX7_9BACL|nr:ATP-binding cassette domain-containing protein [Paenibacillus terricola]MBD3921504.1 ATP-binding cassette domain-containing protein [Paenibacillus terricola]